MWETAIHACILGSKKGKQEPPPSPRSRAGSVEVQADTSLSSKKDSCFHPFFLFLTTESWWLPFPMMRVVFGWLFHAHINFGFCCLLRLLLQSLHRMFNLEECIWSRASRWNTICLLHHWAPPISMVVCYQKHSNSNTGLHHTVECTWVCVYVSRYVSTSLTPYISISCSLYPSIFLSPYI